MKRETAETLFLDYILFHLSVALTYTIWLYNLALAVGSSSTHNRELIKINSFVGFLQSITRAARLQLSDGVIYGL